jgi:type VI secretion system protein ImpA
MVITSSPPVIDIESLLVPISDEKPSGEGMQYSAVYDEIKEARRADDTLNQGKWQFDPKQSDWKQVIFLSTDALKTMTKDLQIAAWLTEGLVSQHGFVGLRDGLKVIRGLHENFWDTVFPEIDEGDDMEARANSLEFLARSTGDALKKLPLTESGESLNYYNWEESKNFDIPDNMDALDYDKKQKMVALQQQATEEKRITGSRWRIAKNTTPRAFYELINITLEENWTEYNALDQVMDEKFGRQTPGLGALKKSLDDLRSMIKKVLEEKRVSEPYPEDNEEPAVIASELGDEGNSSGNGVGVVAKGFAATQGAIQNRQDALKRLTEVADYFRRSEPHSPVSYLVQKAVRWGNMPLDEWLKEVVKDDSVFGRLKETLGVTENTEQSA